MNTEPTAAEQLAAHVQPPDGIVLDHDIPLEYPDLPWWAQPGQTAVIDGGRTYSRVTVKRITKSRIIITNRYGQDGQCDRVPAPKSPIGSLVGQRFRVRGGDGFTYLIGPDEPKAIKGFAEQRRANAMSKLWAVVEQTKQLTRDRIINPTGDEKRPIDERRLDALDMIEAAIANTRKVFEAE
jgi:hypothetical protein